ncbi:MAG: lipopolysaccharide biosynthesis protein, partial [Pedobacter sp.]
MFTLSNLKAIFAPMSKIRQQSIQASFVTYFGFAIGLLNTYFFLRPDIFSSEQYGLYNVFNSLAMLMLSISSLAMPSYVMKFYHYYNDHLPLRKNDLVTWALVISTVGFLVLLILGISFEKLVTQKYSTNSPLFVSYYYWVFPLGYGLTVFNLLEAYTISIQKPVLVTFLREVQWRCLTLLLILMMIFGFIGDFDMFIKCYAFTYPAIAITLLSYLLITRQLHFTFQVSKVTRKFAKKIVTFSVLLYGTTIVFNLSQVFDTLVIASLLDNGLQKAGIFGLATILTSVVQAPQRGIISASIPHLARAWKDKKLETIKRIYERSSINQLLFASLLFMLILLNYNEAIITLHLTPDYLLGFNAFIFLGLTRIVDMGTGVNNEILGTSNHWRFQLLCGIILLLLMLPLTYILAKKMDLLGPPVANLISVGIYNAIRISFLWKKYRMQP